MSIRSANPFYEEDMEAIRGYMPDLDTAEFEFAVLEQEEPINLLFIAQDIPQIRRYVSGSVPAEARPSAVPRPHSPQAGADADREVDIQLVARPASENSSVLPHSSAPSHATAFSAAAAPALSSRELTSSIADGTSAVASSPTVTPSVVAASSTVAISDRLPVMAGPSRQISLADKKGKGKAVDVAIPNTTSGVDMASSVLVPIGAAASPVKREEIAERPVVLSRTLRSAVTSSPSAASRPAKQSDDGAETVASVVPTPGTSAPVQAVAGSRKRGNSSTDLRGTKKQKITPAGRPVTVNQGARPIRVCPWKVGEKAYQCRIGSCGGTMLDTEPSCNAHMMALPHFPIQALSSPPNTRIYGKSDRVPCHWRTETNGRVTVCQRVLGLTELGRHVRGHFTETAWRCPLVSCKKEYKREDVAMTHMRLKHSDVDWDALGEDELVRQPLDDASEGSS
ncbi:hypothetical protein B0H21DRAFT_86937 [Amylocystis lapponica]|nr:hypothetical protein B0H21DRAFT_86937 [Amylocystis lapponica]